MKFNIPHDRPLFFLCIGTDRSTGDAFGPLVGTYLQEAGVPNVIGTLDDTCHAMNLEERAATIPQNAFVIAVDACLGKATSVGDIRFNDYPVRPGAGVGKNLGAYGDVSVTGIVNVGGFMEMFVLQNTQLSKVMRMAKEAAKECIQIAACDKLQVAL